MLLNRLSNFSFLPSTSSGRPSGAQPGVIIDGGAAEIAAKRAGSPEAIAPGADTAKAPAQDSVLLHLDSSSKTASAGTYTRQGLVPDLPSSLHTTPLTPAEEFVAAAVVNLRNYDQAKINAAADAALKSGSNTNAAQPGRFDSIKQAVSKLYA